VVLETLRSGRWPIRDLWLCESVESEVSGEVYRLAEGLGIEVQLGDSESIRARCHTSQHGGVLARVGEFPFWSVESLFEEPGVAPMWLLLDSVQDPHNLGAILRSADVLGVDGVVLARDHSAINGHVARSSAGAVNHLRIARSENLVALVMQLRREGVLVLAAVGRESRAARDQDLTGSLALVIGNEGHGVAEDVLEVCDGRIGIEQSGDTDSLNVAVATGVLLYEVDRQRRDAGEAGDATSCLS
jgi:23S rRNA (guanosine2251-2'-O)-methyltransferase